MGAWADAVLDADRVRAASERLGLDAMLARWDAGVAISDKLVASARSHLLRSLLDRKEGNLAPLVGRAGTVEALFDALTSNAQTGGLLADAFALSYVAVAARSRRNTGRDALSEDAERADALLASTARSLGSLAPYALAFSVNITASAGGVLTSIYDTYDAPPYRRRQ